MKIPWGLYSLTDPPLEHYQPLEDDPDPAAGTEEVKEVVEGGAPEEPESPNQLPYPPFWETDPDQL